MLMMMMLMMTMMLMMMTVIPTLLLRDSSGDCLLVIHATVATSLNTCSAMEVVVEKSRDEQFDDIIRDMYLSR